MGRFEEIELSAKARQRPAINVATDYEKKGDSKVRFILLFDGRVSLCSLALKK